MNRASKWWKFDLQIATPPFNFSTPGESFDWDNPDDCLRFAQIYIDRLVECEIDAVALANHNRGGLWIDYMREAADDRLVVFPGVEITTGSGQDGVHLIAIADPSAPTDQFEELLYATCGFNTDHPRFADNGNPLPSPKTAMDILDGLADDFVAFAPHALNDNGLASKKTIEGALRWKALHHPRLGAIDVGPAQTEEANPESWNARFRNRELDDYPCLDWLPFVSTSDAYDLETIGQRYTWIRMAEPSLEGLRQAFLDYRTRILRVNDTGIPSSGDPNSIQHAWIESMELTSLENSSKSIRLEFDPHLNVIVGGRGSGKSTVVNGLLQVYGDPERLPPGTNEDTTHFVDRVMANATVTTSHYLPGPNLRQTAQWTAVEGSRTNRSGAELSPTEFRATVVSQKELFERSSANRDDPQSASRNLLQLVDGWAGVASSMADSPDSFARQYSDANDEWADAIEARLDAESEASRLAIVEARLTELAGQLQALDGPGREERRSRHDQANLERRSFELRQRASVKAVDDVVAEANETLTANRAVDSELTEGAASAAKQLEVLLTTLRESITAAAETTKLALDGVVEEIQSGEWWLNIESQLADAAQYSQELADLGLDPTAYDQLRSDQDEQQDLAAQLRSVAEHLPVLLELETAAFQAVKDVLQKRRDARHELLSAAEASGFLRFQQRPQADWNGWAQELRKRMSLRVDGFISEVNELAMWLWDCEASGESSQRQDLWRSALAAGDFKQISAQLSARSQFWSRLAELDGRTRIRIATSIPDDVVEMSFLQAGGDASDDEAWQLVSTGSPGQRSAAMLSLVLAHGTEPLILDQPEDDLDTEWVTQLVVPELRRARWKRQIIVVTHNANIPVNGDADRITVLQNKGGEIGIRCSDEDDHPENGPVEVSQVRRAIQDIMEGGVEAFVARERRYNNELNTYRIARGISSGRHERSVPADEEE